MTDDLEGVRKAVHELEVTLGSAPDAQSVRRAVEELLSAVERLHEGEDKVVFVTCRHIADHCGGLGRIVEAAEQRNARDGVAVEYLLRDLELFGLRVPRK